MARRGRLSIRPARVADLPACGRIWRDALNDYLGRLNVTPIPDDLTGIGRLHAHLLATDPDRFLVAVRAPHPSGAIGAEASGAIGAEPSGGGAEPSPAGPDRPAARVVAFAAAVDRGPLWYLSMLFVDPAEQGRGLGPRLLDRVLPPSGQRADRYLAVAADSAQPISNALYATRGMPPRVTLHHLVGRPERPGQLPPLPDGVSRHAIAAAPEALPADLHALDREVLGYDRPADHAYAIGTGRLPFAYRHPDGTLAGYGYASPVGYVGPVAARDPRDLPAITADLLLAVPPRGASAAWVPGPAGDVLAMLVRAGLRIEGFPTLLLWDRPLLDLDRYLPISPGLP